MKEEQVLGISEKCVNCHQREYALWSSGAHATTYADIFLDEEHKNMESPYWDCSGATACFIMGALMT